MELKLAARREMYPDGTVFTFPEVKKFTLFCYSGNDYDYGVSGCILQTKEGTLIRGIFVYSAHEEDVKTLIAEEDHVVVEEGKFYVDSLTGAVLEFRKGHHEQDHNDHA